MSAKLKTNILCLLCPSLHPQAKKLMPSSNDISAIAFSQKIAQYYQDQGQQTKIYYLNFLSQNYRQNIIDYQNALKDYFAYNISEIHQLKIKDNQFIHCIETLVKQWKIDNIICSAKANSGFASGLLPYQIAKAIQYPIFSNIIAIDKTQHNLKLEQFLPAGLRRKLDFKTQAIITIDPNCALKNPYIYSQIAKGKIIELDGQNYADNFADIHLKNSWEKLEGQKIKIAFKIEQNIDANQRMNQFVSSANSISQTKVIKDEPVEQKIDEIISALKSYQLLHKND